MPKIQYRLRDGTLLCQRPTATSHPWPREAIWAHAKQIRKWVNPDIPSSVPYTVEVTPTAAEKRQAVKDALVPRPAIPRLRAQT
jgi:hypothetical protein